jgi:DNA helicase II / ATP-dependent DNA helicase PcrA
VQAQNCVRTDDFVSMVNTLLKTNRRVLSRLQEYKHVLVDEVQDNDVSQYNFVRHLAWGNSSIFFVGDPNQSIYEFRGADVRCRLLMLCSPTAIAPTTI